MIRVWDGRERVEARRSEQMMREMGNKNANMIHVLFFFRMLSVSTQVSALSRLIHDSCPSDRCKYGGAHTSHGNHASCMVTGKLG